MSPLVKKFLDFSYFLNLQLLNPIPAFELAGLSVPAEELMMEHLFFPHSIEGAAIGPHIEVAMIHFAVKLQHLGNPGWVGEPDKGYSGWVSPKSCSDKI